MARFHMGEADHLALANEELVALAAQCFTEFLREFEQYGMRARPGIQLLRGAGMLCYYNLEDQNIYLSLPDSSTPIGRLQAVFLRSLLGCGSQQELSELFRLFIPYVVAHELAHHFRHRYGTFGASPWEEEQVANKLAIAVLKHRLTPDSKAQALRLLRRAMEALAAKMEAKHIAVDSYHNVVHALNVSGQLAVAESQNLALMEALFDVDAGELLRGSGRLSEEQLQRLERRDDLIGEIDRHYTSDQIRYMYYQVGWLHVGLASRETEYVDEFARKYLKMETPLLPAVEPRAPVNDRAVFACYCASVAAAQHCETAGRYFYKRYRSVLLSELERGEFTGLPALKREASAVLRDWNDTESDTLSYLSQWAPRELRSLLPHSIGRLDRSGFRCDELPTDTDRRLWRHVMEQSDDPAAANTLYRLGVLDRTDTFRALPAELTLELMQRACVARYAPGETIIWEGERNDDVFVLLEGSLQVSLTRDGKATDIGTIAAGEVFGEMAFFTREPRSATVRAINAAKCLVFKDFELQVFALTHPTLLIRMAGAMAKRLSQAAQLGNRASQIDPLRQGG
jgi:hypothetical protein